MPRRPRIHLPGVSIHLVQRGQKRDAYFFTDEDFLAYREWLGVASRVMLFPFVAGHSYWQES